MVRLTTRSFLHLLPELVGADFDHPFYARVTRVGQTDVSFRSLECGDGMASREVAIQCSVTAREVNASGELSPLRRPVSLKVDGQVHFGQVIAVEGDHVTVISAEERFVTTTAHISLVPPIVALLLEHVTFPCDVWSDGKIVDLQSVLLDRVIGRDGEVASREIDKVFEGLMSQESRPASTQLCHWVDPQTGESTEFPLQHALDFAYFVDGDRDSVPANVGQKFCRPPTQTRQQDHNRSEPTTDEALELFDPFVDDDVSPQDVTEFDWSASPSASTPQMREKRPLDEVSRGIGEGLQPERNQRRRVGPQSALDKGAMIIEKLGDDPELLDRFLDMRKGATESGINNNATTTTTTQLATGELKPSASRKKTEPTSKYAFNPQPDQLYVHERVTSTKHRGKAPNVFINGLVRSDAVKFKAVPGVCTRAFDIRFGSKGLSIRHFARFHPDERVAWLHSGGSNFDNFSATAEFEKAEPATCIGDIVDSTRVFLSYTREYCCGELSELTETILSFLEETLARVTWAETELPSVVFWVNDVLEDF
ncbi:hypothetical protein PF003_g20749 [Phytophthora fragariae]|nr:hypothetical protein PF003_g20749 [Phytophthora fragariae]